MWRGPAAATGDPGAPIPTTSSTPLLSRPGHKCRSRRRSSGSAQACRASFVYSRGFSRARFVAARPVSQGTRISGNNSSSHSADSGRARSLVRVGALHDSAPDALDADLAQGASADSARDGSALAPGWIPGALAFSLAQARASADAGRSRKLDRRGIKRLQRLPAHETRAASIMVLLVRVIARALVSLFSNPASARPGELSRSPLSAVRAA
jgi:hypothetical protein